MVRRVGFDEATALHRLAEGEYQGDIDAGWWTPRGPLGGYVMAVVMRSIMLAVDDPGRRPRSLTVHFLRPPEPGVVTVRPVIERAGRSLTTASARLEQDGRLLAIALAALSAPRPGPLLVDAPMPQVEPPGPRQAPPHELPGRGRPPFTDLVAMEGRFGARPFSGAEHAETGGWLGLREGRPVDALTVLVLADAWYPAPWACRPAGARADRGHDRALPRAAPAARRDVLGRFRTRLLRDGFFEEDGGLWAPDGTLVAQSRQLGLLIGAEAAG